ncbi:peptidoglycan editing factor PgeF [Ornithinibacillus xuwenensis]|uniref:Purine nucleoside phosphorylase n=1 Tax=Ornithinibacillus xuwenensis TaxID=3144668 RepID=A0ABU9XE42_9BACI
MQEIFQYDDKSLLQLDKWQTINPGLRAGFTSRNGGVSQKPFFTNNLGLHVFDHKNDVILNRQGLSETVGIPLSNWVAGEQVHQTSIHIVEAGDAGKGSTSTDSAIKGVDGLITKEKGILCTAFFADCVPLFFFDPITEYIGIAHAGWKGTVGQIAEKMVKELRALGVNVEDLLVAIGPCISKEKYEVDEYVKERIPIKHCENVLTPIGNEHYLLDLKQLNVEILLQSGVIRNNIDITNFCTFSDDALFFSHRRDNGKTGRMLGYIGYTR